MHKHRLFFLQSFRSVTKHKISLAVTFLSLHQLGLIADIEIYNPLYITSCCVML